MSLNTVRRFSLVRKILLSVAATVVFYLLVPGLNRSGEWYVQLSAGRLYNPFLVMKASFMLVVSVLYGKIFELLYQKQHITIENERLKNENLQTQYNMLANQISPHFLFNSLNSLSMLVREGQNENAQLYIDRLADTFRYMLRSGRSELATLSEELDFIEAYLYLLTIRYQNKLFCDMSIDERYRNWRLPCCRCSRLWRTPSSITVLRLPGRCASQSVPKAVYSRFPIPLFRKSIRLRDRNRVEEPLLALPAADFPRYTGRQGE